MNAYHGLICCAVVALCSTTSATAQSRTEIAAIGDGNRTAVDQQDSTDGRVRVSQIGFNTRAHVTQAGPGKVFDADIEGSALTIDTEQTGAAPAFLSVSSIGAANSLDSRQTGLTGGENIALVTQDGAGNHAGIDQVAASGAANTLRLTQSGSDNLAFLAQDGSGNMLDLIQNGDANDAALIQSGTDLTLAITQYGGASIAITQTGP